VFIAGEVGPYLKFLVLYQKRITEKAELVDGNIIYTNVIPAHAKLLFSCY